MRGAATSSSQATSVNAATMAVTATGKAVNRLLNIILCPGSSLNMSSEYAAAVGLPIGQRDKRL
jgi:hypothetical protein